MTEPGDITTGELGRRVDRLDREMKAGFESLHNEIRTLQFVPAAVYAADRSADQERLRRMEQDLVDERHEREGEAKESEKRAFTARWSLITALIACPLAVIASVVAALILVAVGHPSP